MVTSCSDAEESSRRCLSPEEEMPRKALKVAVELKLRAVSCPGVHLPAKDDIYLSMCFMGQYHQSECLPAVFPLLFQEKMTFEKIFRHAVDPGDIVAMLEYEMVRVELVQLVPPAGDTLASFEEDARRFLFPEPKLVPSFSGVDQEILMTRAPHFPGIAPRLEFSTRTTITECSADAEVNIYPNVSSMPVMRRNTKSSHRPRTSSPGRKTPQTGTRSRSLSPLGARNSWRLAQLGLAQLSLDSADPHPARTDTASSSQPMLSSWPGAARPDSSHRSSIRSSSTVRFTPTGRRKSLSNDLTGGKSEEDSSETHDPVDHPCGPDPSALWRSHKEHARLSSRHREWEEVHARVRGLLTTPRAIHRLVYGATVSEVDRVLARRSISPP